MCDKVASKEPMTLKYCLDFDIDDPETIIRVRLMA